MRLILLTAAAALLAAPTMPTESAARDRCAERITQVRDAAGQPPLDRSPATPNQGYLIAAVDKHIDGCAVMQMHRRIDDLRPIPEPSLGPARLLPAR